MFGPFAEHWSQLAPEVLRPVSLFPRHPFLLARLGLMGFPSATSIAHFWFRNARTKALFAGLAAHSILSLDEPLSSAFGIMLGATAHAVGWPIPRGGAQSITNALCAHLESLGGEVHVSSRVDELADTWRIRSRTVRRHAPAVACKLRASDSRPAYRRETRALSLRPGRLQSGLRAVGSHSLEGRTTAGARRPCISAARSRRSRSPKTPCVTDVMPSGPSCCWRSPRCSIPRARPTAGTSPGPTATFPTDRTSTCCRASKLRSSASLPAFATACCNGSVFSPAALQATDANLIGGDIGGGLANLPQFLFRPTWRFYATSASRHLYLLFLHSSRRRRAWHVRLQRRKARPQTIVSDAGSLLARVPH